MRRPLILAIVLALVLAAPAPAHVTVEPGRVTRGADVRVAFTVPNEEQRGTIVAFTVRIPNGFTAEAFESKPGWRLSRAGTTARWSGGAIAPGQFETFALTGTAARSGELVFGAREVLPGRVLSYTPAVAVEPLTTRAGRDRGARTLAKAALAVAIVGALAAVGTFFFALVLWLRGAGRLSES